MDTTPTPSNTPPAKPRGRFRRTAGFVGKATLALTLATIAYISVGTVVNASSSAEMLKNPAVVAALSHAGLDADGIKAGMYASSFLAQSVATAVSFAYGFSINTSFGDKYYVSDAIWEGIQHPKRGNGFILYTRCKNNEPFRTLLAIEAQPGHTVDEMLNVLATFSESPSFSPAMPWISQENLEVTDANGRIFTAFSKPQTFAHLPYLGPVRNTPDRRKELEQRFPEIKEFTDCGDSSKPVAQRLTTSSSPGALLGVESLSNWRQADAHLPETVSLGGAGALPAAVKVDRTAGKYSLTLTISEPTVTADDLAQAYLQLTTALAAQAPRTSVSHTYSDGQGKDATYYELADGRVSVAKVNKDQKQSLQLSWRD